MLDVVLYGYDNRDRLIARELPCADLRELATFFSSPKAARWRWAEVDIPAVQGYPRTVHYSADALRKLIVGANLSPSAN
jgi:hypothetical protein